MFLLPIAQDVRLRGHFPWITFAILLTCLGTHLTAQSDHDLVLGALKLQTEGSSLNEGFDVPVDEDELSPAELTYTQVRNGIRVRSMPLHKALPILRKRDRISRWQFHPGAWDWNVVRYAFIHADWMHLLTNMMMLLLTGVPLERRFGSRRFGSLFIAGAIAGALGFGIMHRATPEMGLLGASGAVAALMGAFCYFFFTARFTIFYLVLLVVYPVWGTFRAPAWVFLPLWLAAEFAMVGLEQEFLSPVAHTTHVAGFFTGFTVALMWQLFLPDLRARYGRLRTQVAAHPRDLQARGEAFDAALELSLTGDAQRDLQRVISDSEPATVIVSLYRRLRERAPDFQLKGRMLAEVRSAAVSLEDHAVHVDTTNRLCAVMPLKSRLATWLRQAADAQDALGRPELAAHTRDFLWTAGVAPAGSQGPQELNTYRHSESPRHAEQPVSPRTSTPSASVNAASASSWPVGIESPPVPASSQPNADRCEAHGLASIARCRACEQPVCAVCSVKERDGARRCKTCVTALDSERHETGATAMGIRLLGSLALFAAVLAPGLVPVMLTIDMKPIQIATILLIVESLWLGFAGFGLCWFKPWARALMVVGLAVQLLGATTGLFATVGWYRAGPLLMLGITLGMLWFLARPQVGALFYPDAAAMRKRMHLPVGVPLFGRLFMVVGATLSCLIAFTPLSSSGNVANKMVTVALGTGGDATPQSLPVDVPQMLPKGVPFKVHLLYAVKHWPATTASPAASPELRVEFSAMGQASRQTGNRTTAIEFKNGVLVVQNGGHEQSCSDLSIEVKGPSYKLRSVPKCSLLDEPQHAKIFQIRVLNQIYSLAQGFPAQEDRQVGGSWDAEPAQHYALSKAIFEDQARDRRLYANLAIDELEPCGRGRCAVVEMNLSGGRDLRQGRRKALEQTIARERLLLPVDPALRSYAWERRTEKRTRTQDGNGVDEVILRREQLSILTEGIRFDDDLLSTAPRSEPEAPPTTGATP